MLLALIIGLMNIMIYIIGGVMSLKLWRRFQDITLLHREPLCYDLTLDVTKEFD